MEELVRLAGELVEIPSHDDPAAAGDRIEGWLRSETDATVRRDEVGNVIARRGGHEPSDPAGSGSNASLALVGHHDVVPPDESQEGDGSYVTERSDGRLYGRGAADMKGAVAAAMLAFRDAAVGAAGTGGDGGTSVPTADRAGDAGAELVFASFVGEETGGHGARHAIDGGFAPDYAVVGEGSTGYSTTGTTDVAVAHKGRRATTVVASGESAHASVPEEGTNAIYRACDVVETLRSLAAPSAEVFGDRLEGSLAVTEIGGGSAWNVIPDECRVTVDERTVPGERAPVEAVEERDGVQVTVDQDLPPMRCDDAAFVDLVLGAARRAHGDDQDPQRVAKPHATDAGWLSEAGTECVVCGPSEPGEAHTATESVSLPVLVRCYEIYRTTADRFPRGLD